MNFKLILLWCVTVLVLNCILDVAARRRRGRGGSIPKLCRRLHENHLTCVARKAKKTVMFKCDAGFLLEGRQTLSYKQKTWLWRDVLPSCVDIDECGRAPCHNNGICINTPGSYTCDCTHTGHTGTHCESDVDECADEPCTHGSCINTAGSYVCDCCGTGYTGGNCEEDINECFHLPCDNGGVCYNHPGSFSCDCTNTGFSGQYCQNDINECSTTFPCGPGSCINTAGSYLCNCQDTGYTGDNCQIPLDLTLDVVTTTLADYAADDPCNPSMYINIADSRRNPYYYATPEGAICDKYVVETGKWYIFGTSIDDKIPESCIGPFQCGTYAPIWMNGEHPTADNHGPIDVDVCASFYGNCCTWTDKISVKLCLGPVSEFFVYQLKSPPECNLAYCSGSTPIL